MRKFFVRLGIVAVVAAFPALLIGLGLPSLVSMFQALTRAEPSTQVIDLSGPKVTRTCPNGMELKTLTDTRPNFNRNGIVTTVSYECAGPNGATAKPTETTEFSPNPMPSLAERNFFISPAADWMRMLAYPIAFVLVLGLSFFVKSDADEPPINRTAK